MNNKNGSFGQTKASVLNPFIGIVFLVKQIYYWNLVNSAPYSSNFYHSENQYVKLN